jgi:hypothetical protein
MMPHPARRCTRERLNRERARITHISNGSIKEPNDGVTFGELRISYRCN